MAVMNARNLTLFLAAAVFCMTVAVALFAFLGGKSGGRSGSYGTALVGGAFELTDHRGLPARDTDYRGKLMLVQFGFTYCPDVCPTELQKAAATLDILADKAAGIQVLFITIDPGRDKAAVLADYVGAFDPRIIGLTGTTAQIAGAAKAYKVYYAKGAVDESGGYLMDHSSFTYLMDRQGRYLKHFGVADGPEHMARQILQALE